MATGETTVDVTDWDAVTAQLGRFGEEGTVHVESDTASCEVGDATFVVYANGRVVGRGTEAFDGEVETLRFDHEKGTIVATGEGGTYTFEKST